MSIRSVTSSLTLVLSASRPVFPSKYLFGLIALVVFRLILEYNHPVRLVGGPSLKEGRVEVYLDGHWEAVCAGGNWDTAAATVVCRQLGFSGPFIPYQMFAVTQVTVCAMDYVNCTGSERKLVECTFPRWGEHPARPIEAAFVKCEQGKSSN